MPLSAPVRAPELTERIKSLEALAGCPLLIRGGRGVSLTDAGAVLLNGARRMLQESDVIVGVLTDIRAPRRSPDFASCSGIPVPAGMRRHWRRPGSSRPSGSLRRC
jgi:DNA-binding transcriptional LysR family regulator